VIEIARAILNCKKINTGRRFIYLSPIIKHFSFISRNVVSAIFGLGNLTKASTVHPNALPT
jgi:hypothetical protein